MDQVSCFGANILTDFSDDEDEAAELMRELEKIKRERLEQKDKEVYCSSCSLESSLGG